MEELSSQLKAKLDVYIRELNHRITFLVVVQGSSREAYHCINDRLSIVYTRDLGLSKSRNRALTTVNTDDWIWFQDDDLVLCSHEVNKLYEEIISNDPDLVYLKIGSLEDRNKLFKNYSFHSWKTTLKALKLSSIEIIVKAELAIMNEIHFDINLGLGTTLPSCEENLFVYQILNIKGPTISEFSYPRVVAFHTLIFGNRLIDSEARARARGYMLSRLSYWHQFIVFAYWSVRSEPKGVVSRPKRLKLFIDGYKKKN